MNGQDIQNLNYFIIGQQEMVLPLMIYIKNVITKGLLLLYANMKMNIFLEDILQLSGKIESHI